MMTSNQQFSYNAAGNPNYGNQPPSYEVSQIGQTAPPQTYVTQTTVTTEKKPNGMRNAIPELPIALAIVLCIVNFLLPGIGTIIAGFSVLCCGNVGQSGGGRFGTFCINFWVGIAQLLLLGFFFLGWVWSIMWGVAFIAIATEAKNRQRTVTTTTTTTVAPHMSQPRPLATFQPATNFVPPNKPPV
ncbi:protein stum homolog isoform X2 [Clavelina lepadiformis]|uniref:protein stum homolog isoform X2 n=1 Tax=Clavelina lepadiformis TaxID=159417 RepID=UPI0040436C05